MTNLRDRARLQFERRSHTYQGSLAQRLFCQPTSRVLLRHLPRHRPLTILDIGCGTGQLLLDIRDRCEEVRLHGLDLCPGMVRTARQLLGAEPVLVVGDSGCLPFADRSMDVVVCTHSFHHYPDQAAVLREMARVLRPGGRALILDGDRDTPWGWLLYDVFVVWAEGSIQHCSAVTMRKLCRAAGFRRIAQFQSMPLSPVLLTIAYAGSEP